MKTAAAELKLKMLNRDEGELPNTTAAERQSWQCYRKSEY